MTSERKPFKFSFDFLCDMLPEETSWGDPLTPDRVEEIIWAYESRACRQQPPTTVDISQMLL